VTHLPVPPPPTLPPPVIAALSALSPPVSAPPPVSAAPPSAPVSGPNSSAPVSGPPPASVSPPAQASDRSSAHYGQYPRSGDYLPSGEYPLPGQYQGTGEYPMPDSVPPPAVYHSRGPQPQPPASNLPTIPMSTPSPVPEPSLARHRPERSELPQRVPAVPDVPVIPGDESGLEGAPAEAPELARIATYLRDDEEEPTYDRQEGFDFPAVLDAVRGVPGVRDAFLKTTTGGVPTLRLELADDADPGQISREVARLLKEQLGLSAEPRQPEPVDVDADPADSSSPADESPTGSEALGQLYDPVPWEAEQLADVAVTSPSGMPRFDVDHSLEPHHGSPPLQPSVQTPRVRLESVEVAVHDVDAVVHVRLVGNGAPVVGSAVGPAFDGYVLRLCASAAAAALDEILTDASTGTARGRFFIEQATIVPFGSYAVAIVVMLIVCGGWVEQLTGSALVAGDARNAVVRATLAAANRRLEALLP
jgi:hypothetical protein